MKTMALAKRLNSFTHFDFSDSVKIEIALAQGCAETLDSLAGLGQVLGGPAVGQAEELPGSRRSVLARCEQKADPADPEQIADEGIVLAVPGEQHRTTGELPLRFADRVARAGSQLQLGL